jgi:putative membrane protein
VIFGARHGFLGTHATLFWDVFLCLEAGVFAFVLVGYLLGRSGHGQWHRNFMTAGSVCMAAYLTLYFTTQILVGRNPSFGGPEVVKNLVYWPVLFFHSTCSVLVIFFGAYNLITGYRNSRWVSGQRLLVRHPRQHRRVGLVTATTFISSALSAFVIYALLFVLWTPINTF